MFPSRYMLPLCSRIVCRVMWDECVASFLRNLLRRRSSDNEAARKEGHQGIRENGMGRFAIQPLGMEVWPKHSVGWAPNAWPSWANASAGPAISRILARNPSTCDCTNPVGLRPILATHPSLKVHAPKRSHRGRRLSQGMRVHSLEGHRNTMPLLLLRHPFHDPSQCPDCVGAIS